MLQLPPASSATRVGGQFPRGRPRERASGGEPGGVDTAGVSDPPLADARRQSARPCGLGRLGRPEEPARVATPAPSLAKEVVREPYWPVRPSVWLGLRSC